MVSPSLQLGGVNRWKKKRGSVIGFQSYLGEEGETLYKPAKFTFTRNSGGSYIDQNGILQWESRTDMPRFTWKEGKECLIYEEERTNYVVRSNDFTQVWSGFVGASFSNTTSGPLGLTGALITGFNTAGNNIVNNSNFRISTGLDNIGDPTYTFSCWLKTTSGTGTISMINRFGTANASDGTHQQVTVTNEWQRFTFTKTYNSANGGTGLIGGIIRDSGDTLTEVEIAGAQLELGGYVSSYIPTTGSAVTRAAETLFGDGLTNFMGEQGFNGGMYLEAEAAADNLSQQIAMSSNPTGSSGNRVITGFYGSGLGYQMTNGLGGVFLISGSTYRVPGFNKMFGGHSSSRAALYVNGQLEGIDTVYDNPSSSMTQIEGIAFHSGSTTNVFRGLVHELRIYTETPPDSQLESESTP